MKDAENRLASFLKSRRGSLVHYIRCRLRNSATRDAEDLLHDVLVNMLSSGELDAVENLLGYLYSGIRNRIVDLYRRGKEKENVSLSPGGLTMENGDLFPGILPGVHDEIIREELREKIFAAIDRLSPEQRAVWVATELEGHSFQELSVQWGEPLGTLLSRKSRAVRALRLMLEEEYKNILNQQ